MAAAYCTVKTWQVLLHDHHGDEGFFPPSVTVLGFLSSTAFLEAGLVF